MAYPSLQSTELLYCELGAPSVLDRLEEAATIRIPSVALNHEAEHLWSHNCFPWRFCSMLSQILILFHNKLKPKTIPLTIEILQHLSIASMLKMINFWKRFMAGEMWSRFFFRKMLNYTLYKFNKKKYFCCVHQKRYDKFLKNLCIIKW